MYDLGSLIHLIRYKESREPKAEIGECANEY